jgi:hypothetical protein
MAWYIEEKKVQNYSLLAKSNYLNQFYEQSDSYIPTAVRTCTGGPMGALWIR